MNSKRKGNQGEREFAALCREHGFDAARNIQYQSRGSVENPDVKGLEGIHIETKRVERLNICDAMEQSIRDSEGGKVLPIVAHRRNRMPWLVTMRATDWFKLYREWKRQT